MLSKEIEKVNSKFNVTRDNKTTFLSISRYPSKKNDN